MHIKFVRMGAKFDAATKGEYADIQGECIFGWKCVFTSVGLFVSITILSLTNEQLNWHPYKPSSCRTC